MYVKRTLSLTTDASGDVEDTIGTLPRMCRLIGLEVPDSNFDDDYDLTITDAADRVVFATTSITGAIDAVLAYDGIDVAGAAVTDQSGGGPVCKTPLTITIANGGNAQSGTVTVYVEV